MNKLKILVVEDEMIIADNICDALDDLGYESLEPAISYTEAIIRIEEEKPDFAILDIQLSGRKTGIDIAKKIRESFNFPFIFLTSNADSLTLDLAKEVLPPAYLIKPFSKEELYTSIEIVMSNFLLNNKSNIERQEDSQITNDSFFIKNKGSFLKINFRDILYLKSSHVYVELFLKNGEKFLVRRSLNSILKKLDTNFVRVHRSFVVNIKHVTEVKNTSLMVSENEISIGKTFKQDLISRIKLM